MLEKIQVLGPSHPLPRLHNTERGETPHLISRVEHGVVLLGPHLALWQLHVRVDGRAVRAGVPPGSGGGVRGRRGQVRSVWHRAHLREQQVRGGGLWLVEEIDLAWLGLLAETRVPTLLIIVLIK